MYCCYFFFDSIEFTFKWGITIWSTTHTLLVVISFHSEMIFISTTDAIKPCQFIINRYKIYVVRKNVHQNLNQNNLFWCEHHKLTSRPFIGGLRCENVPIHKLSNIFWLVLPKKKKPYILINNIRIYTII